MLKSWVMNRPSTIHSPTFSPLYRQIRGLITRSLESGEWGPGDVIPSESELAVRFGVSQGTVRKAIDEMATENLLVRRQGKGTFVATHSDPRSFFRFLRIAANEGDLQPLKSTPLECWRAKAGADVARTLALETGSPIIIIRRLLQFGKEPAVFDEIYLPGELFHDLTLDVLKSGDKSLYSLFESRYGVRMIRADERPARMPTVCASIGRPRTSRSSIAPCTTHTAPSRWEARPQDGFATWWPATSLATERKSACASRAAARAVAAWRTYASRIG